MSQSVLSHSLKPVQRVTSAALNLILSGVAVLCGLAFLLGLSALLSPFAFAQTPQEAYESLMSYCVKTTLDCEYLSVRLHEISDAELLALTPEKLSAFLGAK